MNAPRISAVVLVALLLGAWGGVLRAESPEEIFSRGNEAYENERYEEAYRDYETVLRYGIRDARVEYNLGNAAFKLGRLGEAILHYERALRLDPTDPDVRGNLALARSRRVDRVQEPETSAPVRALRSFQDRIGPDVQAVSLLVLLWIGAAIVTWCSARPGGWNAAAGWFLAGVLVAAALTGVSWRSTISRLEGSRTAVVLADAADVLAGPGDNNATLFTVHEGLTLEIRAERQGWVQVSLPNGLNGWIPRDAIGIV